MRLAISVLGAELLSVDFDLLTPAETPDDQPEGVSAGSGGQFEIGFQAYKPVVSRT